MFMSQPKTKPEAKNSNSIFEFQLIVVVGLYLQFTNLKKPMEDFPGGPEISQRRLT